MRFPWRRVPVVGDSPPSWPPVRHPHQVFLMAASVQSGVLGMLIGAPSSLEQALHPILLLVWQGTVAVCGLVGLWSAVIAKRMPITSMLLERVSLFTVGSFALVYAVVVQSRNGSAAIVTSSFIGGYGLACLARLLQVNRQLRWQQRVTDAEREGGAAG